MDTMLPIRYIFMISIPKNWRIWGLVSTITPPYCMTNEWQTRTSKGFKKEKRITNKFISLTATLQNVFNLSKFFNAKFFLLQSLHCFCTINITLDAFLKKLFAILNKNNSCFLLNVTFSFWRKFSSHISTTSTWPKILLCLQIRRGCPSSE